MSMQIDFRNDVNEKGEMGYSNLHNPTDLNGSFITMMPLTNRLLQHHKSVVMCLRIKLQEHNQHHERSVCPLHGLAFHFCCLFSVKFLKNCFVLL